MTIKTGHFGHYIFDDFWFVGEKNLHSLKQHVEFIIRGCHHPEYRGDVHILCLPPKTSGSDQDEQCLGADHEGDPATYQSRGCFP